MGITQLLLACFTCNTRHPHVEVDDPEFDVDRVGNNAHIVAAKAARAKYQEELRLKDLAEASLPMTPRRIREAQEREKNHGLTDREQWRLTHPVRHKWRNVKPPEGTHGTMPDPNSNWRPGNTGFDPNYDGPVLSEPIPYIATT